jgi:beta-lactamase regulating signal transducer with metallopeptidase domain
MLPAMFHASTSFLIAMADAAARALVFGCFVAAVLGAFRVKNVRAKLLLWEGVLLAALAMPLLTLLAPAIRVAVPLPNLQGPSGRAGIAATEPAPAHTGVSERLAKTAPRAVEHMQAGPAGISNEAGQPVAPVSSAARREIPWPILAVSAYLAIVLAFLARVFIGMRFGRHLVRAATPIEDVHTLRMHSTASSAAGLRVAPRLAESEIISVPMMLGVRAPAILFPTDWRKWDEGGLAAVLAHEVSHVERHDALTQRLALIHRAIFWFSPLAWWLERHLAELSEQASDDAALAGGADRSRYAETLLGFFAELEAGPERVWWQGVSMAKAGQAEKRVERILAWRGAMSNRLKKSLVVALVAVAAPVVAFTAAVHPSAFDIQDASKPTAPQAPPAPVAAPSSLADPPQVPTPSPESQAAPARPADTEEPVPDVRVIVPPLPPLPQLHATVPRIRVITSLAPAVPRQDGAPEPPTAFSMSGDWNFYKGFHGGYFIGRYDDWDPRFAIVTKDSDGLTMSGGREDAEHARSLRSKIPGDFVWFERDEKSYIISDQATVQHAKQLWQTEESLEKQQQDLSKQQEDLAKQQDDAAKKIEDMKIKLPDLTTEMQRVEQAMKRLSANGGTLQELGNLQGEIGDLQSRIGEIESSFGRERGVFGREQGEFGRKMGELGRQQGEIARKQAQEAREAARQMQQLLDDAVAHGLAKPE